MLTAGKEQKRKAKEERDKAENDRAAKKQILADTQLRSAELREKNLAETQRQMLEQRVRIEKQTQQDRLERWLQTQYPQQLARRLWISRNALSAEVKLKRTTTLKLMAKQNWFRFMPSSPELYAVSLSANWLIRYGEVNCLEQRKRVVRCSATFAILLDEIYVPHIGESRQPEIALRELFTRIFPDALNYVFIGSRSFLRFLDLNDYVLDKTFVHCVYCLSKWLTRKEWPEGLHEWPPQPPPELTQPAAAPASAASSSGGHG